jgi:hypothetical protein
LFVKICSLLIEGTLTTQVSAWEDGAGELLGTVGACESEPAGRGLLLKTASRFMN